jgi:hypothetical protein
MKTLNLEDIREFVLSNVEMINVRGGGLASGSDLPPTFPPIIIPFS